MLEFHVPRQRAQTYTVTVCDTIVRYLSLPVSVTSPGAVSVRTDGLVKFYALDKIPLTEEYLSQNTRAHVCACVRNSHKHTRARARIHTHTHTLVSSEREEGSLNRGQNTQQVHESTPAMR